MGLESANGARCQANNLASALDLHNENRFAPQFAVPPGPFGGVCPAPPASLQITTQNEWLPLLDVARSTGWSV